MFDINKEYLISIKSTLVVVCIAILILLSLDTPSPSLGDKSRGWWEGVFR
jgi:hypothetical protein